MSLFRSASRIFALASFTALTGNGAYALDLDWHGQFRAEANTIYGYTHNVMKPVLANPNNGYSIPLNGDSPATFQNLFFRLKPRVIVNDNISLHSDLWLGTPDVGAFGSDAGTGKNNTYNQTTTGNAAVSAKNLFAEVATDFGTIRVGRMPLNWGLGLVWNSNDKGFDRLPSSGDGIQLITKLGAFKFMPAIIKYQDYNHTTLGVGNAGASDYVVGLMYSNDDEQVDIGVQFMRRVSGLNANINNPFSLGTTGSLNTAQSGYAYNIWDFYVNKKAGIFNIGAEVPLVGGLVASHTYTTVAGALKVDAQVNERWKLKLNAGSANGQSNVATANLQSTGLTAFYFHPDYRPGFLLFNYNYRNIANQSGSPYDNAVTNARFLALGTDYTVGKWTHGFQWLYAIADKTADGAAGTAYFNTWDHQYETQNAAAAQDNKLGFEIDYGLGYDWDESIRFGIDAGLYFPGNFYDYNNSATPDGHKTVFGSNVNMMVRF